LATRAAKELVRRLPALARIDAWQRDNPGVTILVVR